METYTIGSMVTGQEAISSLFSGLESEAPEESNAAPEAPAAEEPEQKQEKEVTETPISELFRGEESERVGDEDDNPEKEKERAASDDKQAGSSPDNLYSSIANSLAEDGALSNLSEDDLKEVKDAETLVQAMKKQVDSMLDETQKRINDALTAGVQPTQVQQYESTIASLNQITPEKLEEESAEGEQLRRALLYQYELGLGVDEARAKKMVDRAFAGGTDIEDAKESLEALKEQYTKEYAALIENNKRALQEQKQQQEEALKSFKKTMLEDKNILGGIAVDAKTRQQALDNWLKPTHKSQDGTYKSAIQHYIEENMADFQMKVALMYTLTDGFKNMGSLLKETVKKEKKKAMKELEDVVNNTQRTPTGTLNLKAADQDSAFNIRLAPPEMWK